MKFEVRIPARINVLGNPSDANEGAHQTISAAVDLFGTAVCEEAERLTFEFAAAGGGAVARRIISADTDLAYGDEFDLFKAAVNILRQYSAEYRQARGERSPRLSFSTEIPRQGGLGGSTVLLLLALASLVRFHRLDPRTHNPYVLAELTQRAEERELGITCGYADRYVPLFGGLAYIDYRGKLHHEELFEEPLATYERLDPYVPGLPLVLVFTGVEHDSGDVHGPMRRRYLEEHARWRAGAGAEPPLVRIMREVGETAWRGKIAALAGDWPRFGELMNENHRLVDEMMRTCGFAAGAGEANNRLIEAGLAAGALGAKLTGAGGGGSVFMLTQPGDEAGVAAALEEELARAGCANGRVYVPSIVSAGPVFTDLAP